LIELSTSERRVVLALLGAAIAGAAAFTAYAIVEPGGDTAGTLANGWLYNAVLVVATAACIARGVLVRAERAGWLALGAALAAWTVGDIYWAAEISGAEDIPYPSIADAFYVAFYPLAYAGIVLIVRTRASRFKASQWLDGAIGALVAAALGAALLAPALIDVGGRNTAAVATNLAYPVGDLVLMAFVIGALTVTARQRGGRPGAEWVLLGAGLLSFGIADALYLDLEATGSYMEGTPLDSLWLFGGVGIALAAWVDTRPAPIEISERASLLFPSLFGIVAVGLTVFEVVADLTGAASDPPTFALALATATLALVVLRLFMALGENVRLLDVVRRESITDSLTGLGNRRLLLGDLEGVLAPERGRPETLFAMFDLDGFKEYNDTFGHSAGDLLLTRFGDALAAAVRPYGRAYRLGGDEFCVIAPGSGVKPDTVLAAASAALSEKGEGFDIRSSRGSVILPHEAEDPSIALRIADHRMYLEKGRRAESAQRQTHDVLVSLLHEREPQLEEHMHGVARLAVDLGRALEMDPEELDVLARAAELHDIGKMAIPDQVLHKPGPLDPAEWELVRSHTVIGQRILEAAAAMAPVARVVRSSHERWDGHGYPDGLSGEAIPLASRIVFACDAFDAMTSDRPYRAAMGVGEALEELHANAGTQFDPRLVELFCERVAMFGRRASGAESPTARRLAGQG
jgi:two-component system cell cycle response regulator